MELVQYDEEVAEDRLGEIFPDIPVTGRYWETPVQHTAVSQHNYPGVAAFLSDFQSQRRGQDIWPDGVAHYDQNRRDNPYALPHPNVQHPPRMQTRRSPSVEPTMQANPRAQSVRRNSKKKKSDSCCTVI
ncbi:hypothetical protein FQN50_006638 [Emmonsiellopsis sp. PD_5]|nr:hypothetical protein FQN50_006638 [Emmonsiellopsis sp. PD_5]